MTAIRPGPDAGRSPVATLRSWTPPPPMAADLARQVRDVVAAVPRFLSAPLLRPWHRRWGATHGEAAAPMPGDHLLPHA